MSANIFISFASQDRKIASTLCKALESRGFECWISDRDILPGENFQVAIVHAIRRAKIMLLVFTGNSNNSQEMTKELALASQQKLIVIPLRVEDVAPSDAFAYEFATRQWIDCFADWEFAMDQLSQRIANAVAADLRAAAPDPIGRALAAAPAIEAPAAVETVPEAPAPEAPVAVAAAAETVDTAPGTVEVHAPLSISELMTKGRDTRTADTDLDVANDPKADDIEEPVRSGKTRLVLIAAGVAAVVGLGLVAPALLKSKSPAAPAATVQATAAPAHPPMIAVATVQPLDPGQTPPAAALPADGADAAAPVEEKPVAPKRKHKAAPKATVDIPY